MPFSLTLLFALSLLFPLSDLPDLYLLHIPTSLQGQNHIKGCFKNFMYKLMHFRGLQSVHEKYILWISGFWNKFTTKQIDLLMQIFHKPLKIFSYSFYITSDLGIQEDISNSSDSNWATNWPVPELDAHSSDLSIPINGKQVIFINKTKTCGIFSDSSTSLEPHT